MATKRRRFKPEMSVLVIVFLLTGLVVNGFAAPAGKNAAAKAEMERLITERNQMVQSGGAFEDISEITAKIQKLYAKQRKPRPGLDLNALPADARKNFLAGRDTLIQLLEKRKKLIEAKAPAAEIKTVTQKITVERKKMIQILQKAKPVIVRPRPQVQAQTKTVPSAAAAKNQNQKPKQTQNRPQPKTDKPN